MFYAYCIGGGCSTISVDFRVYIVHCILWGWSTVSVEIGQCLLESLVFNRPMIQLGRAEYNFNIQITLQGTNKSPLRICNMLRSAFP